MRNEPLAGFSEDAVGDGMANNAASIDFVQTGCFRNVCERRFSVDGDSGRDLKLVDSLEAEVVVILAEGTRARSVRTDRVVDGITGTE